MDDIDISIKSRTTGVTRDIPLSDLVDLIDNYRHSLSCVHVLPIITSKSITLSFRLHRHGTSSTNIDIPSLPTYVHIPTGVMFNINRGVYVKSDGSNYPIHIPKDRGSSILIKSIYDSRGLSIQMI